VKAPTARSGAPRRVWAHARWETRLLLRNGEQLLLTLVIPIGLLLGLTLTDVVVQDSGPTRIPRALATVLTVSVISTAFTSLAIATGFERRSGALRFLGTTPLTRGELLGGKLLATAFVTAVSAASVVVVAMLIGWRPVAGSAWAVPVLLLGTATFAAWGMALAGLLRAEAVLAVANGLFLALIMFGGVVIPAASLPGPLGALAGWLPSGSLAAAMTATLVDGSFPSPADILTLLVWLVAGSAVAVRTFRWS
jgi:ABC-2 type transport system permease protein